MYNSYLTLLFCVKIKNLASSLFCIFHCACPCKNFSLKCIPELITLLSLRLFTISFQCLLKQKSTRVHIATQNGTTYMYYMTSFEYPLVMNLIPCTNQLHTIIIIKYKSFFNKPLGYIISGSHCAVNGTRTVACLPES